MSIKVQLPNGQIAEFPDGTPVDEMERAISGVAAPAVPKSAASSAAPQGNVTPSGPDLTGATHSAGKAVLPDLPEFNPAGSDPISGKATLFESLASMLPSKESAAKTALAPMLGVGALLPTGEDARNFLTRDFSNSDEERLALLQQKYPQYKWSVDPDRGIMATDKDGRQAVLDAPGVGTLESVKRGMTTVGPAVAGGALASMTGPQDAGPGAAATQLATRSAIRTLMGMAGRSMVRALPSAAAGSVATHTTRDLARVDAGRPVPDALSTVGNEAVDTTIGSLISPPLEAAGSVVSAGARRLIGGAPAKTTSAEIIAAMKAQDLGTKNLDRKLLKEAARLVDEGGYKDPAQAYTAALWNRVLPGHTLDSAKLRNSPELLGTLEALKNSETNPFGTELLQAQAGKDATALKDLVAGVTGDASKQRMSIGEIPTSLQQKDAAAAAAVKAAYEKFPNTTIVRPNLLADAVAPQGVIGKAVHEAAADISKESTPVTERFLRNLENDGESMPFSRVQKFMAGLRSDIRGGKVKGQDLDAARAALDAIEGDGGLFHNIKSGDLMVPNPQGYRISVKGDWLKNTMEEARTMARDYNNRFGRTDLGKKGFYDTEYRGNAGVGGGPNTEVPKIDESAFAGKVFGSSPDDFTRVQGGVLKDLLAEFGDGTAERGALLSEAQNRISARFEKANSKDALAALERDLGRARPKFAGQSGDALLPPEYWQQVQEAINAKRVLLRSGDVSQGQKFLPSKITPLVTMIGAGGIGGAAGLGMMGGATAAATGLTAGKYMAKRSAANRAKAMTQALLQSNPQKQTLEALFVKHPALRALAPGLDQSIGLFTDR